MVEILIIICICIGVCGICGLPVILICVWCSQCFCDNYSKKTCIKCGHTHPSKICHARIICTECFHDHNNFSKCQHPKGTEFRSCKEDVMETYKIFEDVIKYTTTFEDVEEEVPYTTYTTEFVSKTRRVPKESIHTETVTDFETRYSHFTDYNGIMRSVPESVPVYKTHQKHEINWVDEEYTEEISVPHT